MKRPSFQFYPTDWMTDPELRMCSLAARGLWIEMLCIMHTAKPYGYLMAAGAQITPAILARMLGEKTRKVERLLAELEANSVVFRVKSDAVLSPNGSQNGANLEPNGSHFGAKMAPNGSQNGSILHPDWIPKGTIFSKRLVRDEMRRGAASGGKPSENIESGAGVDGQASRAHTRERAPAGARAHASGRSSSSSVVTDDSSAYASESSGAVRADGVGGFPEPPPPFASFESPADFFFHPSVIALIRVSGSTERAARSFIGKLRKAGGDAKAANRIESCFDVKPSDPVSWLRNALGGNNPQTFEGSDYGSGGKLGDG